MDADQNDNVGQGKDIADAIDKEVLESVCNDAEGMIPPGSTPEILETSGDPVDLTGSQVSSEEVEKAELTDPEPKSEKETQNDKHAEEKPITHVKNMVSKKVFPITPSLMMRRDLFACDENGKLVHDHRSFN